MRGTPLPFYRSLNQYTFIWGIDKEAFNLMATLCFAIGFSGRFINIYTDLLAIGLFAVFLKLGRMATKQDPQIMAVYRRHIHYKKFYPPISGIHADVKLLKPSVPYYEGK